MTTRIRMEAFQYEAQGTNPMKRSAFFSLDRVHRYVLMRRWADGPREMIIIGLNPSTADELTDDPTIRRCVAFAKRERCAGLVMLNLFALRATDPRELRGHTDPVGPDNDRWLDRLICAGEAPPIVVAAWGDPGVHAGRAARVANFVRQRATVYCLGFTKHLHPRHPLYVRGDAPLVRFVGTEPS